jgi:glycosyltransferase involved in cell wall biosynthesis
MKIAVIIPVYNSSAMLSETLRAIRGGERVPDEIIVVDDGSIDDSGAVATSFGATVIALSANFGPATCRNHAALRARSDVLVFLDADTCVHGDTLKRMESHLELDSELGAVIGSYDDEPRDPGLCSQFRNLAHCYVHHSSKRAALTFWSGCTAQSISRSGWLRSAISKTKHRRYRTRISLIGPRNKDPFGPRDLCYSHEEMDGMEFDRHRCNRSCYPVDGSSPGAREGS